MRGLSQRPWVMSPPPKERFPCIDFGWTVMRLLEEGNGMMQHGESPQKDVSQLALHREASPRRHCIDPSPHQDSRAELHR